MPDKLPKGWERTTLGELVVPSRERALPSEQPDLPYVGLEHVEAQSMKLLGRGEASGLKSSSVRFNKGDVLYGKMRPYLNKVWLAEFDGLGSAEFIVFPSVEGLNNQLLAYRLNSQDFVNFANRQVSGERPRVDFDKLASFPILIPPSREQDRIVAKLDALLSQLAAGESAARRALDHLQGYRAAILNAAVTGELTSTWRKTRLPEEAGGQLLNRLLAERRTSWEKSELTRLHAAGKLLEDERWKARYPDPAAINTSDLPQLPTGWIWAGLEQLGFIIGGLTKNPRRATLRTKLPYLRVGNVYANELRLDEVKTIGVEKEELEKLLLETGDLLIVEGNGSKSQIGRLAIWDGSIERCVHQNHIIKVRLLRKEFGAWILSWLLSPPGRHHIEKVASSTTGLYTLSVGKVGSLPIALPPITEQAEIVRHVEHRLATAGRLAATLKSQLERSRVARQSVLREAFAGKLVTQEPKDEPASALLERIRAAHETEAKKLKAKPSLVKPREKGPPIKARRPLMYKGSKSPVVVAPFSLEASSRNSRQVRLIRLKLYDNFNSLKAAEFPLRSSEGKSERISPLCLVGLNGSGKSNLIEALSEIFCHVELALLPWQSITDKQRRVELRFDLEYQLLASSIATSTTVRLEKPNHHPVVFKIVRNGKEEIVIDPSQCLALLPTRIVGYSSGLNETISIPYFRTAAIYSQEVLKQARRERANRRKSLPNVPDSKTFFMDYECNAEETILISNFLLQSKRVLSLYRKHLRIDSVSAFDIRYRGKYQGNKPVELTRELESYLGAIRRCANSVEQIGDSEVFHFTDPKIAAPRLQRAFGTAGSFFRALYKLSLLNPLALSGKKRRFFLRDEAMTGQLERPPTISREDRIFSVEKIRVNLTKPKRAIDYAAISDGEHQFLQIFGSVILFDEPGCVFLLDEPETHFNPQWRRLSIQWLADIKSTRRQELMISTHSPFVVSGCHKKYVFKFVRDGDQCVCSSVSDETFGASYDFLLARLFSLETMIAGEAIEEMKKVVKSESVKKLRQAIPRFGESLEKRFIFERISHLEKNKKRREK